MANTQTVPDDFQARDSRGNYITSTVELVEFATEAQRQANANRPDPRGTFDFLPTWLGGVEENTESEWEKNQLEKARVRGAWERIAARANAALAVRSAENAAAVQAAYVAAEKRQVDTFGKVRGPVPSSAKPTTVFDVGAVVAEDTQKLSPFYWLGRAYDGVAEAVGLGDQQTAADRAVGLIRLLLIFGVVLGALYLLSRVAQTALGFGAEQTKVVVKALPQISRLG